MAENSQQYTINFQANAKGLDEIIQKITTIANGGNINLTSNMQKDLQKLQVSLQTFMTSLNDELAKENPSSEVLKSLYNTFLNLADSAQKFGLNLSSLSIPQNLQQDLERITESLKQQQREVRNLQQQYRTADSKISSDGGPSAIAQEQAFRKAGGAKLDTGSNAIFNNAEEVKAQLNLLTQQNQALDKNSKEYQENAQHIQELTDFIDKYNKICVQMVSDAQKKTANLKQEIDNRKQLIAQLKAEITAIEQKAVESSQEQETTSQIINLINQLNTTRNEQVDALEQERQRIANNKKAQAEEAAARKKAAAEAKVQAEQYQKNVTQLDANTKKQDQNTASLDKNTSVVAKATKQVITYGTVISLLKRVYSETINTIKDMDEALTGMAVVTSMSRAQT